MKIVKNVKINSKNFTLDTTITVSQINGNFPGVENYLSDSLSETDAGSIFTPPTKIHEYYVMTKAEDTREMMDIQNISI